MELLTPLLSAIDLKHVVEWMDIGWPAYFVLFGLLFSCGLGVPIPEDIPLLVAGMLCGQNKMEWTLAGILAWMGIIGGDCCLYYFGHRFGLNITRVPMVGKHVTKERILKAERLFQKYGVMVVAVGRMFAGIRGAMVVAAGTIRFNFAKFLLADGLAALVSGGLFIFLGYKFGENLDVVEHAIKHYGGLVFAGVMVVVVAWVAYAWWKHKRHASPSQIALEKVAEACEPAVVTVPGVSSVPSVPPTPTPTEG